tara:strand:- start:325 stop:621 length:297 start_codon:yes stop_codon:yes gene_type:complete
MHLVAAVVMTLAVDFLVELVGHKETLVVLVHLAMGLIEDTWAAVAAALVVPVVTLCQVPMVGAETAEMELLIQHTLHLLLHLQFPQPLVQHQMLQQIQ